VALLFAQFLDILGLSASAGGAIRVGSNLLLAGAFLALPVLFGRARRHRPAAPRSPLKWCAAWAVLCGVAYLADALALLTPLGATAVVVKVAAAVGSWVALVAVIRSLPRTTSAVEQAARDADLERLRLLEAAVTASADGVMIAETAYGPGEGGGARILYANPAFERLTGYLASEAIGQSPSILHDDPPSDGTTDPIRAALRGRDAVRVEAPNRRKDGSRVWSEWHVVPVANSEGKFAHWIAILRDTTARRREKEELRRTRDFLTSLLDNFPVPVHVTDEHGRYRLVNPAWEHATGVTKEQAVGKSPGALFPTAVAAELARQTAAVRADDKPVREKLEMELRGDRRVFLTVAFPLPGTDGRAGSVGGVALDVTDQTRAEKAVRKLNAELKRRIEEVEALVDLSPVGIAVAEDPGGRCVRVNRALRELLGLPPEEDPTLTPAPVRLALRFRRGGADLPPEEAPMARALATGRPVGGVELQVVPPDGRERTVVNSARPLFDEAGRVRGCLSVYTDITERVRTEEALRRSESFLRLVWESAADGMRLTNRDGNVLMANPAYCRLVGRAADQVVGRDVTELVAPGRRDDVRRKHGEQFEPGTRRPRYETEVEMWDGRRRWFEVTSAFLEAPGEPPLLLSVVRDTTDRRRAELELRERQELLRTLVNHVPCGVFRKDRNSVYLGANDRVAHDHGLASAEELVGRTDFEICSDPAEAEFYQTCDRRVMETEEPLLNIEESQTRADGTRAVLLTSKVPLRDAAGAVIGVLGVYQDITDRKRADEALRASERHLRALIEASPECVKLVARDGTLVEMNPAGLTMIEAEELAPLRGRPVTDLVAPEDRAAFAELHREVCEGRARRLEYGIVGLRGTRRVVETQAVPLPGPDGRPLHLAVTRDVTERKRLEEQYRQAQKMEAVGRLAGGVAHDFNNLLTVINGYGEMLRDRVADAPDARDLADEVCRAGARAAALTRQLLAFSRRSVLEPRVLDVNAAIGESGKMIRRLIGETVDLRCELATEPAWVRTDPGHLDQVILNLVVNARDAMPDGGRATIRTAFAELSEADARSAAEAGAVGDDVRPGAYVVLEVSDTGCGMTEEVRRHIFEPFFTTKAYGSGLGLATVYGIVKQSGGHIRVTSEPGRGTDFAIYLPRVEAPPAEEAGPAPAASRAGTETVLLAEDEDGVRGFAGAALRAAGYTVLEAADGQEALRVAAEHPDRIDVLVTDLIMPHLGGRGLAESLAGRVPAGRVLYLSGYTDDAVVREGVQSAEVAFLHKPFVAAALTRKVRELLDEPAG
jgi:PAS domain S-box-containing protein